MRHKCKSLKKKSKQAGITLIALVVTVVLLLVLAGVSIGLVLDNNGLITRAINAKESSTVGKEKDFIGIATAAAMLEKDTQKLNEDIILKELENLAGNGNVEVERDSDVIIVKYKETGNIYEISDNGDYEKYEKYVDETPGILDGEGTELNPYKIESIEDLLAFSIMTRGGNDTLDLVSNDFSGEYVILCRKLDFKKDDSYNDPNTKIFNDILGYSSEDITLKEILTNGNGFISTGTFSGEFDGNNKDIKNIYINMNDTTNTSFITKMNKGKIKNLTLTGKINGDKTTVSGKYIGGIVGNSVNSEIDNCISEVSMNIATKQSGIGGISGNTNSSTILNCKNRGLIYAPLGESIGGITSSASYSKIKRCMNESIGEITGKKWVAGIAGWNSNTSSIEECGNYAKITGEYAVAGIVGSANSTSTIDASLNKGEIIGQARVGGLVGYIWQESGLPDMVTNSYNAGSISSNEIAGGITGMASDNGIVNCYNIGAVMGKDYATGGIIGSFVWGSDYTRTGRVVNCYSYATVNNPNDPNNISGVIGKYQSGTVKNSYFLNSNKDVYMFEDFHVVNNSANTMEITALLYRTNMQEKEIYSKDFIKNVLSWGEFVSKEDVVTNKGNVWNITGREHPTLYWE